MPFIEALRQLSFSLGTVGFSSCDFKFNRSWLLRNMLSSMGYADSSIISHHFSLFISLEMIGL